MTNDLGMFWFPSVTGSQMFLSAFLSSPLLFGFCYAVPSKFCPTSHMLSCIVLQQEVAAKLLMVASVIEVDLK